MKILHVITSLRHGGAQLWMQNLVREMPHEAEIITLLSPAPMAEELRRAGVNVHVLDVRTPQAMPRLALLLRAARADVIQTWMHHADLVGGALARLVTGAPVIWNIRATRMDVAGIPRITRGVVRMCALTSGKVPARIICASRSALEAHAAAGYRREKMIVIPNGCDTRLFRADEGARLALRQELGIPPSAVVVGLVARVDPLKDHPNFLAAAAMVAERRADVHFVLCGAGTEKLSAGAIGPRLHRLGRRDDISHVTAALDISCLSSYTEAFPNVVAESLACEVPTVATDVGDSRSIIQNHGIIVPPRDPVALATGILELIDMGDEKRRELGRTGRARIESEYSMEKAISRYLTVYDEVVAAHATHQRA